MFHYNDKLIANGLHDAFEEGYVQGYNDATEKLSKALTDAILNGVQSKIDEWVCDTINSLRDNK